MPGMAACWQSMEETHQSEKLSLRDGLQILIQAEKDSRDSNRIAKLIKNANFRIQALIEELEIVRRVAFLPTSSCNSPAENTSRLEAP